MPEKGLRSRARDATVDLPSHPQVRGRVARAGAPDLATLWLDLRFRADDAREEGDLAGAARTLLALGASLVSTQSLQAGIMVLDEALELARASGDVALVDRVTDTLDRTMLAAQA